MVFKNVTFKFVKTISYRNRLTNQWVIFYVLPLSEADLKRLVMKYIFFLNNERLGESFGEFPGPRE